MRATNLGGNRVRRIQWTVLALGVALAGPPAWPARAGQQAAPPPAQTPPPAAAPVTAAPAAQVPAESYSYEPEGRRDPFVPLTTRLIDARAPGKRPEGLPGQLVSEVALKGIIQNQKAFVALLQAPDGRTYLARPGDRLFDGVIKTITASTVILLQEVNDPLSLTKQREVRKTMRALDEGK